ncbi:MAG: hypothetical protein WC342_03755 [Methanoregula sp.]
MKRMKVGVMLLAFLLAAMAIVPMVSAENVSETPDEMSDSLANETKTINGETLPVIQWVTHEIDGSKYNKPLTREEFLEVNKEYIEYINKTAGKEAAEKYVNDYYTKKTATTRSVMVTDPTNIQQIMDKDVWLWAYESPHRDLNEDDPAPITWVVIGNTVSQFKSFLESKGWAETWYAGVEYGFNGQNEQLLDWGPEATDMEIFPTPDRSYRYHCTLHEGGYSAGYNAQWSFGECHKEIGPFHNLDVNAFTKGETYLYNTIGSSYNKYSSNLDNSNGYFDGNGHVYKVR